MPGAFSSWQTANPQKHIDDKMSTMAKNDEKEQKRERKAKRRQKYEEKLAKRLAKLGLDINGDELDNYSLRVYPVREWKFTLPGFQDPVALNPIVSLIGIVVLWGLVGWCAGGATGALDTLTKLKQSITLGATNFYQISKAFLFFFMFYIMIRFGHVKLGQPDDKPEFSNLAYFVIFFAVGSGSPLIASSVQEVLHHQNGSYYTQAGYRSQDEVDMFAVTMTVSNWSIPTWTHYTIVGMCMSLAGHRFRLPMTFRSCFYPMLGSFTWGWIGDLVDGATIVMTVAGLVSTLTIAAGHVASGLQHLGYLDEKSTSDEIRSIQNVVIWVITALSTATVISGLQGTILHVCHLAVGLTTLLMVAAFLLDDKKFLLNLIVQEVGMFFQMNILQNNFWTDAFGQLQEGSGRAVDGKAADQFWMDTWTVFYIAWAVTWSPFAGMILAFVSRGRKLWEIPVYGFVASVSYCLVWFCIWGGISLRQSRQSLELAALGSKYFNNSRHFLADGSDLCYDVPQSDVVIGEETIFTNHLPGVTPVCQFDASNANLHLYNVLNSFNLSNDIGLGKPLYVLCVLAIPILFMATSAACSLVVDILASNGRKNEHWARRMFWVATVGVLATIVSSSGAAALNAIFAASIVSALPFAILLLYLVQSITLMCRAADRSDEISEYTFPDQPEFVMPVFGGIFNVMEHVVSFGDLNAERAALGLYQVSREHALEFFEGILVPFHQLHSVLDAAYPQSATMNATIALFYMILYVGWVCLLIASQAYPALSGVAWTIFILSGCVLGMVRSGFRNHSNLRSNHVADIVTSLVLWPQVLTQMRLHIQSHVAISSQRPANEEKKKRERSVHRKEKVETNNGHVDECGSWNEESV